MKRYCMPALLAMLLVCSCHDEITPTIPVEIEQQEELVLNMSTETITKAIIEGSRLPDNSSVGLFITDDSGFYEPAGYKNIKYTSRSEGGAQVWESENPIYLSDKDATLYSYYPHIASLTSMNLLPVTASSTVQVDYMWGNPVNVSKGNRVANITMKHALSVVRVTFVRGTYSGDGIVSKVSFSGGCAASIAALDITNGTLSNFIGQGAAISPAISKKTLSSTSQKADIIVIPTQETDGKITMTIDGKDYFLEFGDIELHQGEITQFHLTVNDGQLSLSDITVSEWTYSNVDPAEIKVSDKVTLTGDLENIAVHNSITDGTVTIKAMPTSGEVSFTEVEPVTLTGTATLTQSSDIDTGIRTITISDIQSNVEVVFAGTIEYHVVLKLNSEKGVACDMLGANVSPLWEQRQTLSRMDWNDERILGKIVETGKYSTKYKEFTFPESGTQTIKCLFKNNVITHNIFQMCDYYYARIGGKTQEVDYSAFLTCKLKEVYISEGVELIDSQAFGSTAITTLKLPSTLSPSSVLIVNSCPHLTSIILPQNLQKIGNLFGTCSRLTYIACKSKTAPVLDVADIFKNLPDNGVLVVPEGADYSTWMSSENLGGKNWTIVYKND